MAHLHSSGWFHLSAAHLRTLLMVGSAGMALLVMRLRVKAAEKPASRKKIVMPPLGMSTGFLMFAMPWMRFDLRIALAAFAAGLLLSLPLIRTSRFEVRDGEVYLQRSKAFLLVLIGLFALRIVLHEAVGQYLSLAQTGSVLFVLAYGMMAPWRAAMWVGYQKVRRTLTEEG
ncbi:cytochrome c biogenesis protein CcdC [Tumebacillus sp. DT12]|uniref:Cytochrome c biogenesis protein CcdC n=1 Tax=Tumebacillus lacus TaxID=2995335 RepID=A0ABT3WYI8_9BACL|nr:cytochrome c biogenesis protein CcdC [Tumebacillus lacus]MCX7569732.1 cytochrome c biogenesis protein CcdC [Tumebacillus lacus]